MDSSFNAFQIFQSAVEKLSGTYDPEEAAAMVRWLLEEQLSFSRVDIALKKPYDGSAGDFDEFLKSLERVTKGEPLQYVLGYAEFLGEKYEVNPAVLIPRPETEELVLRIGQENPGAKRLLDIGTGSGCIAIALAKSMGAAEVSAWDVDENAIKVASGNARRLKANVHFQKVNVLDDWPKKEEPFDLIVSNPPYITEVEKKEMRANVLEHEPSKALFVPDQDPLLFYREIAKKSTNYLANGGQLYFEINEHFGESVVDLLQSLGYKKVELFSDFQEKPRMVKATWVSQI